jgi:hypothetical protein
MDTNDQRAEHQLLFCVARRNLDPNEVVRLRHLLGQTLDWGYLQNVAFDQGLLTLLSSHVISHGADLLQPAVLDRLRAELLSNRQSNLYLVRELVQVLSRFESAGIEALAFKGPLLSQLVYGDLGLRQAGDMDILIHPNDFHRAAKLLRELDYEMEAQLTQAQERARFRFHCEIQFVHEDRFSVVDLHWGITPSTFPLALTSDDFLANRKEVYLAGHPIETFTDEELVFYLSVHAAKHYFRKVEWIATIAELIRGHSELSWAAVIAKARKAEAERIMCLALMLVESLYELRVPAEFADLAGSPDLRNTAGMIRANLLTNMTVPNQLQKFRWKLRFLPMKDAYLSLARAVLVPTISDWRAFSVPDALYPVYYLLRPVRLLAKYGRRAVAGAPDG